MKINETEIRDLYIITLEPIIDDRGFFVRSYCMNEISEYKKNLNIVQINHTLTKKKGTVRGMHYQLSPACETKIVRCIKGSVFDVAVDLREDSETYLQWHGEILSDDNMKMFLIPEGFAHGFQTLEENCEMLYLHSEFYKKEYEGGILYNDPKVGIDWPLFLTSISERDMKHPLIDSNFRGIKI